MKILTVCLLTLHQKKKDVNHVYVCYVHEACGIAVLNLNFKKCQFEKYTDIFSIVVNGSAENRMGYEIKKNIQLKIEK